MRARLLRLFVASCLSVVASWRLAAQGSPFVPLGDPATALAEHLIARGVMADPAPLTRPFDRGGMVRALQAVDTTALSSGERRALRTALADPDVLERGPFGRLDGHLGAAAATYPVRDPLELDRGVPVRGPGKDRGFIFDVLDALLLFAPAVDVVTPNYIP